MTSVKSVALLGLKGSGKTTFLAALWHLLEAQEVKTPLRVRQLQPNREYLNQIVASWLSFKPVPRTSLKKESRVDLMLQDASGTEIDLSFPDISGESFRIQWELRRAQNEYVKFIQSVSGFLLFVSPVHVIKPERISIDAQSPQKDLSVQEKKWTHDRAPTQVQLIELIQNVRLLVNEKKKIRLGVMVSAWDTIGEKMSPVVWLESHLPLLFQFLRSNIETMEVAIFGVSAQGSSYEEKSHLTSLSSPSKRVEIRDIDGNPLGHDLSLALEFALGTKCDTSILESDWGIS